MVCVLLRVCLSVYLLIVEEKIVFYFPPLFSGRGNVSMSAEFNFHTDPEAAYMVFRDLGCPITLIPLELCWKHSFDWVSYLGGTGPGGVWEDSIPGQGGKSMDTWQRTWCSEI